MLKKRALVLDAFAEVALAGYTFDLTPDELQTGLQRLEQMAGDWVIIGLSFGYNLKGMPGADLDDDAFLGLTDEHAAPYLSLIVSNLAKALAGGFGKQCAPSTIETARRTYRNFLAVHASVQPPAATLDTGVVSSTQRRHWI